MKILQINCVYPGGSTGRITQALHRHLLSAGHESLVVYGRGAECQDAGIRRLCPDWYAKGNHLLAWVRGIPYGGCLLSTARLICEIRREKPDVVHLQCTNGYFVNCYRLIAWLKRNAVPTVLTLHAEFWYTGGCSHAMDCEKWMSGCENCPRWRQETGSLPKDRSEAAFRKMERAFRGFEEKLTVVSVSEWLAQRAVRSRILGPMKHRVIGNGVDTNVFCDQPVSPKGGRPVIFHGTAFFSDAPDHPKGGWALLEMARRMPEVDFRVAGKYRICGEIPENVTLLGEIQDPGEMALFYSGADVTLLTSKRETFSMICAESLCCGTPVVGFRAGGPEEISLPQYSTFVPWGDLDGLEKGLKQWLTARPDRKTVAQAGAARYDQKRMAQEYEGVYRGAADENTA